MKVNSVTPGLHNSRTLKEMGRYVIKNKRADNVFPIIHIIGLPGAGKTTLGRRLSKKLGLPVYHIGQYRARFPMTLVGEADAWVALFRDLSRQKWKNCILETTGLNSRESFLKAAFPILRRVTIKLEARRTVLYARIKKKREEEQGGEWLFGGEYRDKCEFVKKLFKDFDKIPVEIRIDTNKLRPDQVFKIALKKLKVHSLHYMNFMDEFR